jgi:hypothetical protein
MPLSEPGVLGYVFSAKVLKRSILIALVVGTVLSAANQLDVILREPMSPRLCAKIFFNYLVPFLVSSVSAAFNRQK